MCRRKPKPFSPIIQRDEYAELGKDLQTEEHERSTMGIVLRRLRGKVKRNGAEEERRPYIDARHWNINETDSPSRVPVLHCIGCINTRPRATLSRGWALHHHII